MTQGEQADDAGLQHVGPHFRGAILISYIGQFITLLPGDVISTGTPSGVGLGFQPPRYLKSGDVVVSGIDGLGGRQRIMACADQRQERRSMADPGGGLKPQTG